MFWVMAKMMINLLVESTLSATIHTVIIIINIAHGIFQDDPNIPSSAKSA
jgi:hypothetical protein